MSGLVENKIKGYFDIKNAILRVGQLDVVGIQGVDMATNVLKQDSVLIWDDQGADLMNPPFTIRGGAGRDTSSGYIILTGASGGRITRGIKLPNAWMMDFDLYASTMGGTVKIHCYTTQESFYDGSTGYELEFAPSARAVTLRYRGVEVHQATSVTYATNTFQHVVVGFERGAWTVSIDGKVVFLKDDDERADVYDNTAGQYFRIDASEQNAFEIRVRKFRLASNGFWLKERNGNLSYETGNVSVGGRNSSHKFDVRGSANVGALTSTTIATSAVVEATDTATGTVTTHSIGVVSNAHVQNVYVSNCIVDASLNVFASANVGALTATSVSASDSTAATSVSTGAIVVSGTDGGLGVASNIHATNVFAASHVGVDTSDTDYNLDVRGTANVGVLSATLPLATVASNIVTYDAATGQLLDSTGLVSSKLTVVSEHPPDALSGETTTLDGGKYIVASSTGTSHDAFDKSTGVWESETTYDENNGVYTGSADLGSESGEWLTVEFPRAATLRHVTLSPGSTVASFPGTACICGTNDDGTTWAPLKSWSEETVATTSTVKKFAVDASVAYKKYALVVKATSAGSATAQVGEWRLFTETFSVDADTVSAVGTSKFQDVNVSGELVGETVGVGGAPTKARLQVHGSLGMGGGSQMYAGDSVIMETPSGDDEPLTWRSVPNKPEHLVSLKNGNLAVGLRDPEHRLVVAGDLQEFPPAPMTASSMQFAAHGVYTVSSSSNSGWNAFNDNDSWYGVDSTYSTTAPPIATNIAPLTQNIANNVDVRGEWVQLDCPCGVIPRKMRVEGDVKSGLVLGSNDDGANWHVIDNFDLATGDDELSLLPNKAFKHLRLVVTQTREMTGTLRIDRIKYHGVPMATVDDGRQLDVGEVTTSSVLIGTTASHAPLTVFGQTGGTSVYAKNDIVTQQSLVASAGTLQASDRRIKNNILDVNDSSALETFRVLQPKLYNYRDVVDRGSLPVLGFIAQDVADTMKYSTEKRTEWIPNVLQLARVHADGAVLEFITTKLEAGASRLRLRDAGKDMDVDIAAVIDEYTVRLNTPIKSRDEVFVYGQQVQDFHVLKKDAIWTTAAAALQQVDRELQAEKAKTKALESKLAGERVPLENAEGLAIDANYAPSVTANDPLFLGIVGADGCVETGKRAKVWVTNIGAPLSAGDIITTTSNVAGYCSKLTDLTEVHRAVGKVLVDVALPEITDHNFVVPTVPRKRKVTETSNATVWVREFKSTAEQYATLPEDERRVRDEVYYARDDVVEVVHNEYVDKMPAYHLDVYHRTQVDTCSADIYKELPESEKVNYVLGVDGVYVYTHVNMITVDEWRALEDIEERDSFVHGYFKNTTTEMSEDEWAALDSAARARYEKRTRPVYFRLIVARESRVGYTEEVRAETVDVLDAFGRPMYENVEGETDPAFEFRYLTKEGSITDRHNGVFMAAMVECLLF